MVLHDIDIDEVKLAHFCRSNGILELRLFGSITRDDFSPDSDVDVIVTFTGPDHFDLFDLGRMQGHLNILFGRQVHLHTSDMIHPYLRKLIYETSWTAYAA